MPGPPPSACPLEATFFGLPFALVYRVAPLTHAIARRLVRLRWVGIANILVVWECIQGEAEPAGIADELLRLLNSSEAREALVRDFDPVIAQLGEPGASAPGWAGSCEGRGVKAPGSAPGSGALLGGSPKSPEQTHPALLARGQGGALGVSVHERPASRRPRHPGRARYPEP